MVKTYEPLTQMYYLKRAILIYERVFGKLPEYPEAQLTTFDDVAGFAQAVEDVRRYVEKQIRQAVLSDDDANILQEFDVADFMELAEVCDFDLITDKHHHRKFFNEIENDFIIETLLAEFERLWQFDMDGPFFIDVYDFNDYRLFFASYDDLASFVRNYDVAPYTAFEMIDNVAVELYSE